MAKKENSIQAEIMLYLKGNPRKGIQGKGGWWLNFHGGDLFMPMGIPDIIGCYKGRFVALEVKRPGEQPRKLQEHTISLLRNAGAAVAVVFSREDVVKFINLLDGGTY